MTEDLCRGFWVARTAYQVDAEDGPFQPWLISAFGYSLSREMAIRKCRSEANERISAAVAYTLSLHRNISSGWIPGIRPATNSVSYGSPRFVYLWSDSAGEDRFVKDATGLASHPNRRKCWLNGLCELIERHVLQMAWLKYKPLGEKILLDDNHEFFSWSKVLSALNLKAHFFRSTGCHPFLVVAVGLEAPTGSVAWGSACGFCAFETIERALCEALAMHSNYLSIQVSINHSRHRTDLGRTDGDYTLRRISRGCTETIVQGFTDMDGNTENMDLKCLFTTAEKIVGCEIYAYPFPSILVPRNHVVRISCVNALTSRATRLHERASSYRASSSPFG